MKTKRWNNLSFFLIQKLLQINFRWANDRNSKRIILYHNLYEINSEIFLYTFSVYRDFHFSVCSQFRRDTLPDFFRDIPVSRYQGLFGHFYAGLYAVGLWPVWFANLFRVKFKIESIESLEMSLKWFAHVNQKKRNFWSTSRIKTFFIFHSLPRIGMNRFGPITDTGSSMLISWTFQKNLFLKLIYLGYIL